MGFPKFWTRNSARYRVYTLAVSHSSLIFAECSRCGICRSDQNYGRTIWPSGPDHYFVTELCASFGGVDFSLGFICVQSVSEFLWDRLRASIQFPVMPKRAQYARFSGEHSRALIYNSCTRTVQPVGFQHSSRLVLVVFGPARARRPPPAGSSLVLRRSGAGLRDIACLLRVRPR